MADTYYQLIVQKGPKVGQVYPLVSTSVIIGRDPMADVVISDPEVSRQHVRLTRIGTGYELQDLGSTNGTFIDGGRLGNETVDLIPGQLITMGSGVVLLYEVAGAEEDDAAPLATMAGAGRFGPAGPEPADFEAGHFDGYEDEQPRSRAPEARYRSPEPRPGRQPAPAYVSPAAGRDQRRRNTIIAAVILLILCCCCALPLSGWFIWGDPLLEWLRVLGFFG